MNSPERPADTVPAMPSAFTPEGLERARALARETTNMQQLAALAMDLLGLSAGEAYPALPLWNVRTVQRLNKQRVAMKSDVVKRMPPQLHGDTLTECGAAAVIAGVRFKVVRDSVNVYGSSPERVLQVLRDIATVREYHFIWNPTGFFVARMHDGKDVELPPAVLEKRLKAAQPKPTALQPGMMARLYGQTMKILAVGRLFATLEGPDGEIDVTLDRVRLA